MIPKNFYEFVDFKDRGLPKAAFNAGNNFTAKVAADNLHACG